jgi:hypothetical protein
MMIMFLPSILELQLTSTFLATQVYSGMNVPSEHTDTFENVFLSLQISPDM